MGRPRKRIIPIAGVGLLSLAAALLYDATREPRVAVLISNQSGATVSDAELACPEGRWSFGRLGPGESRAVRLDQASALDLKFRCADRGGVRLVGLSVGPAPGEFLKDVEFRIGTTGVSSEYHLGAYLGTTIRMFVRALRGRLGL